MAGLSGASETLGALTLTANSALDFGLGNSNSLLFSGLNMAGYTVTIYNWTGSLPVADPDPGGGTQDRLRFSSLSLTATELEQISFYNDAGVFIGNGRSASAARRNWCHRRTVRRLRWTTAIPGREAWDLSTSACSPMTAIRTATHRLLLA